MPYTTFPVLHPVTPESPSRDAKSSRPCSKVLTLTLRPSPSFASYGDYAAAPLYRTSIPASPSGRRPRSSSVPAAPAGRRPRSSSVPVAPAGRRPLGSSAPAAPSAAAPSSSSDISSNPAIRERGRTTQRRLKERRPTPNTRRRPRCAARRIPTPTSTSDLVLGNHWWCSPDAQEEGFPLLFFLLEVRGISKRRKAMALRAAAARLASSSRRRLLLPLVPSRTTAFLHSHATSFGYKQVREDEKSKLVGNVFSSVASSYDLMNDLMSVGLHRLWKDRLISELNPFPGMKHLDVAGGTGDVAFRVLERIKSVSHRAMQGTLTNIEEDTHIYVCDINPNMLNVGKKRAAERGYREEHCLSWIQGDAEALSFEDGSMDGYTIAFGIRNVTHIEKALSEAYRVLKRGGRFLCLELSHVDVPLFKEIYDIYSFSVIPAMGELVAGDRQSYQYLVESIRRFPNQQKFAQMIQEAGFERVEYENLVGGVVAIHSGLKL